MSRGQKPRTPWEFPRMKYRARKRHQRLPRFPRQLWPTWVDVINAMIAIEWQRAGYEPLPEDPLKVAE